MFEKTLTDQNGSVNFYVRNWRERWKKRLFSFIRIKSDILMKGERAHENLS
jgi:hypothetical protein